MKALFTPTMFTPTQWNTAEDKAKFANHFVRFVDSDFKPTLFQKWFYARLSNTFGHIAHYNQGGFFEEFFTNDRDKIRFLTQTVQFPCYGDPRFTFSDVEQALAAHFKLNDPRPKYQKADAERLERVERAELERLQAKYG